MSEITLEIGEAILTFVKVPVSTFVISETVDFSYSTRATLSDDFWLARTPTTRLQWREVMRTSKTVHTIERSKWKLEDQHPMTKVDWYMATSFCHQLNCVWKRELPNNCVATLPTEIQWELGARADTAFHYYIGNTEEDLSRIGWYSGNSNNRLQIVGQKEANSFGLYDMCGNVYEWCLDSPGDLPFGKITDWINQSHNSCRVVRGGCYKSLGQSKKSETLPPCSTRSRSYRGLNDQADTIGFRVCINKLK